MSEQAHRANLLADLATRIRQQMEDGPFGLSDAFNRVSARALGYAIDDEDFVDGAGDCGIDLGVALFGRNVSAFGPLTCGKDALASGPL